MSSHLGTLRKTCRALSPCTQQSRLSRCWDCPAVALPLNPRRYSSRTVYSLSLRQQLLPVPHGRFRQGQRHVSSSSTSPPPPDYYTLFSKACPGGPPPEGPFVLDTKALRKEFLKLQQRYHPDLQPISTRRQEAENASSYVNGAYNTLKDPLSRAHYLLGLQGLDPSGDEVSQLGDSEEEMELLTTVMEAQEELDELPDMSLVVAGIREEQKEKAIGIVIKVLLRNAGRIQEAERILAEAFAHSDLASARKEAVRLKYWLNIQRKAWEWDERSGNREVRKKIEEMKQVKAENEHRNQKGSVMADTATSTMLNHLLSS